MAGFVGRYDHSLDAKGRIILPSRFRSAFEHGGHLTEDYERCLSLWTDEEFSVQAEEMKLARKEGTAKARNFARLWAAQSFPVDLDRQGRMSIPPHLRDFAGLSGEVLVTGAIDHIELWHPEEWRARVEPAQEIFLGGTE